MAVVSVASEVPALTYQLAQHADKAPVLEHLGGKRFVASVASASFIGHDVLLLVKEN